MARLSEHDKKIFLDWNEWRKTLLILSNNPHSQQLNSTNKFYICDDEHGVINRMKQFPRENEDIWLEAIKRSEHALQVSNNPTENMILLHKALWEV